MPFHSIPRRYQEWPPSNPLANRSVSSLASDAEICRNGKVHSLVPAPGRLIARIGRRSTIRSMAFHPTTLRVLKKTKRTHRRAGKQPGEN